MALVAGVDNGLRAKQRKMARHSSDSYESVQIQQVTCIRGGARNDWLVLPLMTINGRQCAGFSQFANWLQQLLNGGCGHDKRSAHLGAITNFLQECLDKFKERSRQ